MKKAGTGQWAGWLGAAIIAATGGALLLWVGPDGFSPEVPMISFINDVMPDREFDATDAGLRSLEKATTSGDVRASAAREDAFVGLVAASREKALRLLDRYESGEFDGTPVEGAVLRSLVLSGEEDVVERATDAARRRELEETSPRGADAALESVRDGVDPRDVESIAAEDLDDTRLLLEVESLAERGATSDLRISAIRALARARDVSVTEFLVQRLEWETEGDVRQALALSLMMRPDALAGERLATLLATRSEPVAVRRCAAQGLSQHGRLPSTRTSLLEAMGYDEPDVLLRVAIVNGLGAVPADRSVEDRLITALEFDPSDAVKVSAAMSLMNSPTARTCDALRQAIATSDSTEVRATAEQTLTLLNEMIAAKDRVELSSAPPSAPR